MATTRPFARNTGGPISNSQQVGNIAIGTPGLDYSQNPGGVKWWMGPDEDNNYVIAKDVPAGNAPTVDGNVGTMGFWAVGNTDDAGYAIVASGVTGQNFGSANSAAQYLNDNGYWSNFSSQSLYSTPSLNSFTQPVGTVHIPPYHYSAYFQKFYVWSGSIGTQVVGPNGWITYDPDTETPSNILESNAEGRWGKMSPDGKVFAFLLAAISGSTYDQFSSNIAVWNLVTNTVTTASVKIPGENYGSGNTAAIIQQQSISYDSTRNEFLVGAGFFYNTPNFNRIVRFSTGSGGNPPQQVGYYAVSASLQVGGNTYNSAPQRTFYDPSIDSIWYWYGTSANSTNYSAFRLYKIGHSTPNSSQYLSPTSSNTYLQGGHQFSPETQKIYFSEGWQTGGTSRIQLGVFDTNAGTFSSPSSSVYEYTGSFVNWGGILVNNNSMLMDDHDLYFLYTGNKTWGVNTHTFAPSIEIDSYVNPNSSTTSFNQVSGPLMQYFPPTSEAYLTYSPNRLWNGYDISGY